MAAEYPMTYEEFLDNYEFKVVKRLLKKEYPWIKDVFMKNPDEINKYNMIFVDLFIDPYELERMYGWKVNWFVTYDLKKGGQFWSPYLSTFFTSNNDEAREMTKQIEKDMKDVHRSPALPRDLIIPGDRTLGLGSFHTANNITIPEDTEQSSDTQL
jgi:hypothetical protein